MNSTHTLRPNAIAGRIYSETGHLVGFRRYTGARTDYLAATCTTCNAHGTITSNLHTVEGLVAAWEAHVKEGVVVG